MSIIFELDYPLHLLFIHDDRLSKCCQSTREKSGNVYLDSIEVGEFKNEDCVLN